MIAALAMGASLLQTQAAWAQGGESGAKAPSDPPRAVSEKNDPASVLPEDRTRVLGNGWQNSADRTWTTSGDADGFHILTAEKKDGYAWRTAATLAEPGFDADAWIGNACVTASGRRVVVVYAPRTFTNKAQLMARGGFTAIVDLETGEVSKLGLQASLSYYNPGCGTGETAVLTQSGGEDRAATRLVRVDAVTGKLEKPVEVPGQLTSAVPVPGGGIAAAAAGQVVSIGGRGKLTTLATTSAVPYRLTPDAEGGVVFLDKTAKGTATVKRIAPAQTRSPGARNRASVLAEGPLTKTGITRSATGQVFVTGATRQMSDRLPSSVRRLASASKEAQVSTRAEAVVTRTAWADGKNSGNPRPDTASARPVRVALTVLGTGKKPSFSVNTASTSGAHAREGRQPSPALRAPTGTARHGLRAASPSDPVESESERTCSVPRNDPRNQAMQPKPRQVEWAVDQLIQDNLDNAIHRPANWKNLGMPAYSPGDYFTQSGLVGGGHVPAQVMLGVTMQESNMWQASRMVVPGVTGNPLIGNFYGISYASNGQQPDPWAINWGKADCGYGITQATDRMRLSGKEKPGEGSSLRYDVQRAVALDYTVNLAYGHQILTDKWNDTRLAGLTINNGDAARPENWFFALWAYNSGFHPQSEASKHGGAWGVGWGNNPANPEWDAGRSPFLSSSPRDAAHPQDWPYEEKVLGFAAYSFDALESPGKTVAAFRPAWWTSDGYRQSVKPPEDLFCTVADDSCDPSKINDGAENEPNAGPCKIATGSDDIKFTCWWHKKAQWKDCSTSCGNEIVRFNTSYPEEADGTAYPPNCSVNATDSGNAAPPKALVIDDTADGTASVRPNCPQPKANAGKFTFAFAGDGSGLYPSKMDLHQLGAGFGGHFYLGHTRTPGDKGGKLNVSGTWQLKNAQTGWHRIAVHLPDHGAWAQQAHYVINLGDGTTKDRYINQGRKANNWVSLGVYKLNGRASVTLSTETEDGTGDDDIAFDAVAFQPLPGKPRDIVAALGDSYSSGEGSGNYYTETDADYGKDTWSACRRGKNAWPRKMKLPGQSTSAGELSDAWSADSELGFVACSGAWTTDVARQTSGYLGSNGKVVNLDGQFREAPQIDSGVLDENTTMVTLSIGGNDAGFPQVLKECALTGCPPEEDIKKKIDAAQSGDPNRNIVGVGPLLELIRAKAPNAKIMVMGYPQLFGSIGLTCVTGVGTTGAQILNRMAVYMQQAEMKTVESLGDKNIVYVNPDRSFDGKRACDDPEGINKLVKAQNGDGDFKCLSTDSGCISRESYHPNKTGTSAYADAMQQAIGSLRKANDAPDSRRQRP
ncbi:GDSL-type esterase/lipase family protein [Streptomyces antimycoticus]|uniref:golvesin C-terminal-like domain-containing protein n=1 Tax=Streptomyces antimycoticus TaxID=68175 RepID=UPI0037D4D376